MTIIYYDVFVFLQKIIFFSTKNVDFIATNDIIKLRELIEGSSSRANDVGFCGRCNG